MNGLLAFLGGAAGAAGQMYMKQEAEEKAHERKMEETRARAALDVWKQLEIDTNSPTKQADREYKNTLKDVAKQNAESLAAVRKPQARKVGVDADRAEDTRELQKMVLDARQRLDLCKQVARDPSECTQYEQEYRDAAGEAQLLLGKSKGSATGVSAGALLNADVKVWNTKVKALVEQCNIGQDKEACAELAALMNNTPTNKYASLLGFSAGNATAANQPKNPQEKISAVVSAMKGGG